MVHSARPDRSRVAGLHDRLQIVEERLGMLEHDLREALNPGPRRLQVLNAVRRSGGMGGSASHLTRAPRNVGAAARRRSARSIGDELLMEVRV